MSFHNFQEGILCGNVKKKQLFANLRLFFYVLLGTNVYVYNTVKGKTNFILLVIKTCEIGPLNV